MTLKLTSTRDQRKQSVIEVLEEALDDAKNGGFDWIVVVGESDKSTSRRWSGYANVLQVLGALEDVKFELLSSRAGR